MLYEYLEKLHACDEALKWVKSGRYVTIKKAWRECPRADWLLWLAAKNIGNPGWPTHQEVVLATCDCAETALRFVPEGEERPKVAIETAHRWAVGKATIEECNTAAWAAADAARDAADADAWAAADAAADAATTAAADTAYAYAYAADTAYTAADAYAAAYAAAADAADAAYTAADVDAARARALRKMATIVRRRLKCGEIGGTE